MSVTIHDRTEGKRGCGYRKGGGLYLVSGGIQMPCGRLPIPLTVCPCCSAGIKPSRGWTWVDADKLAESTKCNRSERDCIFCPLGDKLGKAGLLWVGEKFYPTPGHFTAEAMKLGISRRIHQIPRDFVLGNTYVLFAHRKVVPPAVPEWISRGESQAFVDHDDALTPGVFNIFLPQAIEYIVTDQETTEQLEALAKRGFTLVRVHRDDGKPTQIAGEETDEA